MKARLGGAISKLTRQNCRLVLSQGDECFQGELIGSPLVASGELVFTTGMVGYTEAMTDPSYFGQILVFTYPLIGNYGIPPLPEKIELPLPTGFESSRAHVAAVIVTIDSPEAFHWTSLQSLNDWLCSQNVPGIVGLDTRHLVHLIRDSQNLLGRIEPENPNGMRQLGETLTPSSPSTFFDPSQHKIMPEVSIKERRLLGSGRVRIGLIDCGVKWNIIRQLLNLGCEIELLPYDTDLDAVDCSGWLISNGPGDPSQTNGLEQRVRTLLTQSKPILGICLGNQILARAAGAQTRRMSYGHRSHNQPVCLVGTRRGFITSQNHGYEVIKDSIPDDWEPWFVNVNDQSIEGIRHTKKPFRSVQFHPESAGGPRDTGWILTEFVEEVSKLTCR